jgi:selenium metabolism protein YedF
METTDFVVYINSDRVGVGAEQLGRLLMSSFLRTLAASSNKPGKILFVNSGVYLTTEGSEVLDTLKELADAGVEILSCGTCLDYYRRKEVLRIGAVGNMAGTVDALRGAGKVLTP